MLFLGLYLWNLNFTALKRDKLAGLPATLAQRHTFAHSASLSDTVRIISIKQGQRRKLQCGNFHFQPTNALCFWVPVNVSNWAVHVCKVDNLTSVFILMQVFSDRCTQLASTIVEDHNAVCHSEVHFALLQFQWAWLPEINKSRWQSALRTDQQSTSRPKHSGTFLQTYYCKVMNENPTLPILSCRSPAKKTARQLNMLCVEALTNTEIVGLQIVRRLLLWNGLFGIQPILLPKAMSE